MDRAVAERRHRDQNAEVLLRFSPVSDENALDKVAVILARLLRDPDRQ